MSKVQKQLDAILNGNPLEGLAPVIAGAVKEANEKKATKTKALLVNTLESADAYVNQYVSVVRNCKKQLETAKANLTKVSEAVDALKSTGNPMQFYKATSNLMGARQFCQSIGCEIPDNFDSELFN